MSGMKGRQTMAVRNTKELEIGLSPDRLARIDERVREAEYEMLLHELKHQAEIASAGGGSSVDSTKDEGAMSLTVLGQIVRSLGGTLTIRVAVPGKGEVTLNGVDLKQSA